MLCVRVLNNACVGLYSDNARLLSVKLVLIKKTNIHKIIELCCMDFSLHRATFFLIFRGVFRSHFHLIPPKLHLCAEEHGVVSLHPFHHNI